MPVFDSSGEEYGQQFAHNLTAMEFHKLEGSPFDVVLLNPGGLYNPLIPESIVDYAQAANVDTVLIMSFLADHQAAEGRLHPQRRNENDGRRQRQGRRPFSV